MPLIANAFIEYVRVFLWLPQMQQEGVYLH